MPFAQGPVLVYAGNGNYVTSGVTEYQGRYDCFRIPDGLPTDLATVPRIAWAILPPHGAYENSAVVHDWLCIELAQAHRNHRPPMVSARDTDGVFRRILREESVGFLTRWVLWTGCRWGALANPARRQDWLRDSPTVLGITAALLATAGASAWALDTAAHWLLSLT